MSTAHTTVVVVADDGVSPVGSDEWNASHEGIQDDNCEPTTDQTIRAGYSTTLTGLPLIIDSGRLVSIAAGGVLVLVP